MSDAPICDVAVVGYGPTGAVLAGLLLKQGLRVAVVDKADGIYPLPRAVHFDGETMRTLQTLGLAGEMAGRSRVNVGMRFVDGEGRLLLDWPRPQEIGPQGWYPSYRFHQPDLEAVLRAHVEAQPRAEDLTGCEVTGLEEADDHVTLTLTPRGGGAARALRARYVVGCDGANSFVRGAIGAALEDLGFAERWLVVDLILTRPRPDLGLHTLQICDPGRPMTYCCNIGDRRRFEITLKDDEPDQEVTRPERIWQMLASRIGPEDARLERHAIYTFRSALADHWGRGRVWIAGDAAHLTPPFMGQGLCAGIRDAVNLGWKLAAVLRGRAGPGLLDSYGPERAPNARVFVETAMRLGGLINALDREAALAMAEGDGGGAAAFRTPVPPLGESDLGGLLPRATALTGHLAPQPLLADGRLLDDAVGYDWVLLSQAPLAGVRVAAFDGRAHPGVAQALEGLSRAGILVRPDRHIALCAGAEGLGALLDVAGKIAGR